MADRERVRVQVHFNKSDPKSVSRVKRSFKDECDINKILAKARKTGLLPVSSRQALYGDFSNSTDFFTMQVKLVNAHNEFMKLPSDIRSKFDHNPGKLIAWLDDPANKDEAIKLGLMPMPEKTAEEIAAEAKAMENARISKLKDDLRKAGLQVPA